MRFFHTLNHDLTECHEIDSETGEVAYTSQIRESRLGEDVHVPIPALFPGAIDARIATDESFADDYEEWKSGTGNPLIERTLRSPEEFYALSVLRSYLPGFTEAEESADPYKENTSPTPRYRRESTWSLKL